VRRALAALPEVYRVPLALIQAEEMSYRDLAKALRLPPGNGDVSFVPRSQSPGARALGVRQKARVGENVEPLSPVNRMSCEQAMRQFFAYLDRALSGEPLALLDEHLKACLDCCDKLGFSRQLDAFVKSRLQDEPLPEGIEARIRKRLAEQPLGGPSGTKED
jgi:anti-sigma factor (TIGR02949 family)